MSNTVVEKSPESNVIPLHQRGTFIGRKRMHDALPPITDTAAALDFLQHLGQPFWGLHAIQPDGPIESRWFSPEQTDAAAVWIRDRNRTHGIYFNVNITNEAMAKKPNKSDVNSAVAYWVDCDAIAGRPLEEEIARIIGELQAHDPAPSIIVNSGGGAQAYWLLPEPVHINGDLAVHEARNRGLEQCLGGDHCFNIDRIMRLPGTVNFPNKKKLLKHPGRGPRRSSIISADWSRRFNPASFTEAAPEEPEKVQLRKSTSAPGKLPDRLQALVEAGPAPGDYDSRSEAVFAAACGMAKAGWGDEAIVAALLEPANAISDHVLDQANPMRAAQRTAARAIREVGPLPRKATKAYRVPKPEEISLAAWLSRDIPDPDFVLGQLFSTTSRALLIGPTGLGKTNFSLALSISIALGRDFLHWKVPRACRVLYVDGEMSQRLAKQRMIDAMRRSNPSVEIFFLCRDADDFPPVNTPEGQDFFDELIAQLRPEFIVFDNLQALLVGNLKETEAWSATLTWARSVTAKSIGQLWVHHTGRDKSHGYGDSGIEWQLDTVMLMEEEKRPAVDICFKLTFPKARERFSGNRADFAERLILLDQDQWASEACDEGDAEVDLVAKLRAFRLSGMSQRKIIALKLPGMTKPFVEKWGKIIDAEIKRHDDAARARDPDKDGLAF